MFIFLYYTYIYAVSLAQLMYTLAPLARPSVTDAALLTKPPPLNSSSVMWPLLCGEEMLLCDFTESHHLFPWCPLTTLCLHVFWLFLARSVFALYAVDAGRLAKRRHSRGFITARINAVYTGSLAHTDVKSTQLL